MNHTIGVPL